MNGESIELLKQAAAELNGANKTLQSAFATWSETVTAMHMAEVALREAQRRMVRAYSLLTTALEKKMAPPPTKEQLS